MVERNKLGKAFGPYAAFAGILLFIAGMFAFRSPVGILLLLAGIFLATATDETHIDVARRRIRPATVILGFIPLGTWQSAGDFKGLTLIPVYRRFSVYSLSNKQKISEERDFRIFILDKKKQTAVRPEKMQGEGRSPGGDGPAFPFFTTACFHHWRGITPVPESYVR